MHACCVRGCSNSSSSGAKVKFYRLPTSYRPFQAERRRLWLRALQRVAAVVVDEGEDDDQDQDQDEGEELWQNARICSAHFLSGRVSMDPQDVDFVPSVFPTSEELENGEKSDTRGRKRHRTDEGRREEASDGDREPGSSPHSPETAQDSKAEERTSGSPEDGVPPSTPTEPVPLWASSKMAKISPVVVLWQMSALPSATPSGGEPQEPASPRPVPPPAFPCNMCERRFADAHLLKRHKLLHIKDDRKCARCGALFCRVHRRAPAGADPRRSARVRPPTDSDYVPDEARQRVRRPFAPVPVPEPGYVLEPGEVVERVEDFETSWNFIPLLASSVLAAAPEPWPERGGPGPRPRLPPALRAFSPLYLTSAFLRVERNYRYLLSKAAKVPGSSEKEAEESLPVEPPPLSPPAAAKRAAAFDLEIAI
ncbi:uncharacterized protein LOC144086972 [Stigmatopora argus]